MPKLDMDAAEVGSGSRSYPEPYKSQMAGRSWQRLGQLAGLTQFGVNIVTLEPGAPASLRHWHSREDEFAIVLEGELVLVEDAGETVMRPGDCAAWKAGEANGHRFVNRSDRAARFLVVGSRRPDDVTTYSDVDMVMASDNGAPVLTHHDGSPWSGPRPLPPKGERE